MKVVHLSTADGWRGGEQQLLYLAAGLRERGVEQCIACRPDSPLAAKATGRDLRVVPLAGRGPVDPLAAWALRTLLKREGADLVHAHDAHGVTYAAVGGWLAGRGVGRVCTRRVDFPLKGRWKYARMDAVICISQAIRRVCREGGVPEENLSVVYSGIDPDRFRGREVHTRELAASFGFDRRDPVLLNVASLTDHKGQRYLLEAMLLVRQEVGNARLLIAGTGELEADLKRQARELALDDAVRFLGFRDDVGDLLALADLFVMSSHLEGLCTSVLDAMAMERAAVVTDAGGLPELVEDGEQGRVVPARDPEALAGALVELLGDRRAREKMGRAGRRRVLERFTFDRMVEGTLARYREICRA